MTDVHADGGPPTCTAEGASSPSHAETGVVQHVNDDHAGDARAAMIVLTRRAADA